MITHEYDDDLKIIADSNSSYEDKSKALLNIGKDFGITEEMLDNYKVNIENLFRK